MQILNVNYIVLLSVSKEHNKSYCRMQLLYTS